MYTADGRSDSMKCYVAKYADASALNDLINNDNSNEYLNQASKLTSYCNDYFLELDVNKNDNRLRKNVPQDAVFNKVL